MHILIHDKETGTRLMRPKSDEEARAIVYDRRRDVIATTRGFTLVDDKGHANMFDGNGTYMFTIDAKDIAGQDPVIGCSCATCLFELSKSRCLVCGGQADAKFPFCPDCAGRIKPADWKASVKACSALHGMLWVMTQPVNGDTWKDGKHTSIKTFHGNHAKRVARAMFKTMGATVIKISHNPAGPGVAGEVWATAKFDDNTGIELSLFGDDILYPQPEGSQFLYRSLRRNPRQLTHWHSGVNRYLPYRSLARFSEVCNMMARETRGVPA